MLLLRSFQLEWLKMRHYRIFWILFVMYLLALLFISTGGMFFLEWLKSKGADFDGLDPTIIPIYDFPDIWMNITWLSAFFKLFPAFVVIISVNNDLTYNTLRQNVVDGISKRQYLISKLSLVLFLALASTLFLLVIGLVTGAIYSHVHDLQFILMDLEFLFAFFLQVVTFCMLAFLLSLVIKKSGFVIVALFLWTIMFEPILAGILGNVREIREYTGWIVQFLPTISLFELIDIPFKRYALMEVEDYLVTRELLIVLGWLAVYTTLIYRFLVKRDLK